MKSVSDKFQYYFSEDYLKYIFEQNVALSGASGLDNLTPSLFHKQLDEHVEILRRKACAGSYDFTKYKLKLIPKGKGKPPREISIPTVRDRIALRALKDFLSDVFDSTIEFKLPQDVIKEVKSANANGEYTGFIKLDVSNFYPSIKHSELISRIGKRVRVEKIKNIIERAISTPTVSTSSKSDVKEVKGVPQGLSVSNVLAAIYMINIDRTLKMRSDILFFRYVDDVLIFCDYNKAIDISEFVISKFKKIGLEVHPISPDSDKSVMGRLGDPFSYLGYYFRGTKVTARKGTVDRLKDSLAAIFTAHRYSKFSDEDFLMWRLDMRITGCVFEGKSKGWLFFFSEIDDEQLLHQLDHYVKRLASRFNIKKSPKRFSRAFKELKLNRHQTTYIPNFDNYDRKQKIELLTKYFPKDLEGKKLTESQINYHFGKRIRKQTKDLLEDIKDFRS